MSLAERRREHRIALQIPFEFRSLARPTDPMRKAMTQNISPRGIYFTSKYPFAVGAEVEVRLEFPKAITGKEPAPVRCEARVMHVEQSNDGVQAGIGMFFERMELTLLYGAPAVKVRAGAAGMI